MKIVSWNVNGLRSLAKNDYMYWQAALHETKPDIFCLQETKAAPEQLPEELLSPAGYSAFFSSSEGRKGYSGVALYTKLEPLKVIYGMGIKEFDQEGRLVGAEFEDFWLINVYFPNGGMGPHRLDYKLRFYDAFLAFTEKLHEEKPVIFCGDINTAHEDIDLAHPKENEKNTGFLPEERAWLDEVVATGYIDAYRHFFPSRKEAYTYWDTKTHARNRNVGWRLDYFFTSNELAKHLKKVEIHSDVYGSDHCPISLTLR